MRSLLNSLITIVITITLFTLPSASFAQNICPPTYYRDGAQPGSCDTNWGLIFGSAVVGAIAGYIAGHDRGRHGRDFKFPQAGSVIAITVAPTQLSSGVATFTVQVIAPNSTVTTLGTFTAGTGITPPITVPLAPPIFIGDYTVVVTLNSQPLSPPANFVIITPIVNNLAVGNFPIGSDLTTTGSFDTIIVPITE